MTRYVSKQANSAGGGRHGGHQAGATAHGRTPDKRRDRAKAKSEVRANEPKRIQVPKYLPKAMADEYRATAKKLVALHIFSDLDYDMLARYFIARAAWQNAQNWANRAIMQGDAKESGAWTKTANIYFGQCQSTAAALGLSVSARCRLVMPEPPKDEADEDPLSKMLRERAERRKA
ncbi:phage terminase small subunit P27 family [Agathobaculum butyriciproducens]|nr:phage terminase small subunit P27 family [Agathobaculum butyriciproducens]